MYFLFIKYHFCWILIWKVCWNWCAILMWSKILLKNLLLSQNSIYTVSVHSGLITIMCFHEQSEDSEHNCWSPIENDYQLCVNSYLPWYSWECCVLTRTHRGSGLCHSLQQIGTPLLPSIKEEKYCHYYRGRGERKLKKIHIARWCSKSRTLSANGLVKGKRCQNAFLSKKSKPFLQNNW